MYYPIEYLEPVSTTELLKQGKRVKEVFVEINEREGGVSSIRACKNAYYMINVILSITIGSFAFKNLYQLDFHEYRLVFIFLILAGTFNGVTSIYSNALTIFRKTKEQFNILIITLIINFIFSYIFSICFNLNGVIISLLISMIIKHYYYIKHI